MTGGYDPFPQDALSANQGGGLTDAQRRQFRGMARSVHKSELGSAGLLLFAAIVLFVVVGPSASASHRLLLGIGCVALALYLVVRAATGGDALTRDLRRVRVESVDGAIGKHMVNTGGSGVRTSYYLDVAGQRFLVGQAAYHAAPDAGIVRLYYLPRSRHVVNLERLPDRPLPEGATTNPLGTLQTLGPALLSRDRVASAEAHATLSALEDTMKAESAQAAVPPPQENRDPRPLAQAIIGTWSNGLITVTFAPDGTLSATLPGGLQRAGHWSVEADGRLRADAMGHDEAADAWVVGDRLTISLQGAGLAFTRVSTD